MSYDSPYRSPRWPSEPQRPQDLPGQTPGVLTWYKVYCVLMALLYVGCFVAGVFLTQLDPADFGGDADPMELKIQGYVLLVMGLPLAVMFGIAPFLPRRHWAWIFGFIPICLGMTSFCCLPFTIPLLIFWIKPETKKYFDRGPPY